MIIGPPPKFHGTRDILRNDPEILTDLANGSGQPRMADGCRLDADLVVLVAPAGHRDTRKFTGSRFTVPTRIAGLPGATGNHRRRSQRSGAKLDVNRRVGILGERTQRRQAIGA